MATSKIDASDLSEEFKEDMEPMVTSDTRRKRPCSAVFRRQDGGNWR